MSIQINEEAAKAFDEQFVELFRKGYYESVVAETSKQLVRDYIKEQHGEELRGLVKQFFAGGFREQVAPIIEEALQSEIRSIMMDIKYGGDN
jgi:hypothetical protein